MSARVRVRRGGDVKGLARIGSAVVPRFWRFGLGTRCSHSGRRDAKAPEIGRLIDESRTLNSPSYDISLFAARKNAAPARAVRSLQTHAPRPEAHALIDVACERGDSLRERLRGGRGHEHLAIVLARVLEPPRESAFRASPGSSVRSRRDRGGGRDHRRRRLGDVRPRRVAARIGVVEPAHRPWRRRRRRAVLRRERGRPRPPRSAG